MAVFNFFFFFCRMTEISTTNTTQCTDLLNEFERNICNSELAHNMQELIGAYLALERYFLKESVNKAVGMDTLEQDQQISSMVDILYFYILTVRIY